MFRDAGSSSSVCITGLPFGTVKGMRRLGIRRLDAETLVLVLISAQAQAQARAEAAASGSGAPSGSGAYVEEDRKGKRHTAAG
jgi:hypothetical protein